jgi:hypothetical protein
VADVPFALSPQGIANRPVGAAGRPVEAPATATAWAWGDVHHTTTENGWILINGRRFCRDTGHLRSAQILGLARMEESVRTRRIEWWICRWLRPAHLRRRVLVLMSATRIATVLNGLFLATALLVSLYLAANLPGRMPATWTQAIARTLPWIVGWLLLLHGAAVIAAWAAVRRLKATGDDKRGLALFSAALLPPQALRLRGLAGDAFLPAQHPVAYALAFTDGPDLRQMIANSLGDMRWPVGDAADSELARVICGWHRYFLTEKIQALATTRGVAAEDLFRAPRPDGPASCRYCPRCGSQFVSDQARCPHGVTLQPLARS